MKTDKRTAVVMAIREYIKGLNDVIEDLPYKKTPLFINTFQSLCIANINDYFKCREATEKDIKQKAREGWYEPDFIEKGEDYEKGLS